MLKIRKILVPTGFSAYSLEILDTAVDFARKFKASKAGLILLTTHGRTGLSHLLMGSTAEKVVRKSSCPVLTVRPPGHRFQMP